MGWMLSLQISLLTFASAGGFVVAKKFRTLRPDLILSVRNLSLGAFGALLLLHMLPQVFSSPSGIFPLLSLLALVLAWLLHSPHASGIHTPHFSSFIYLTLSLHSFADGLLLRSSMGQSSSLSAALFIAFFLHKILESFWLGSIAPRSTQFISIVFILIFIGIFPAGFFTQEIFNPGRPMGLGLSAVALGFFLACYLGDYIFPLRAEIFKSPRAGLLFMAGFFLMAFSLWAPRFF